MGDEHALFVAYAWNDSPIDGTDIIRSFAAKARTFHFPLDIQMGNKITRIPGQGEATIQHVKTMFPLWFRQKELLKELTKDRREAVSPGTYKQEQEDLNVPARRPSNSREASEFECNGREACKVNFESKRPVLQDSRRDRKECILHTESTSYSIIDMMQTRKANERSGNANHGEAPIIIGDTQANGYIRYKIGMDRRLSSIEPIGKEPRILQIQKIYHHRTRRHEFHFRKDSRALERRNHSGFELR